MSANILVYGTYPLLLETHKIILEHSGFHVAQADSITSFRALLDLQDIDLCIFCSSLADQDRDQSIAILSILHPELPYMILSPTVGLAARFTDRPVIDCLAGPENLIHRVRECLPAAARS